MEELREQLSYLINNSQLPAECVYYVFKDVYRDLNDQYKLMLEQKKAAVAALESQSGDPAEKEE